MDLSTLSFDIASLKAAYASGVTVRAVVAEAKRRCASDTHHAFIHRLTDAEIEPFLAHLDGVDPASLPLYGVPFAIKDNIDLAHIPTTAGCPEYAYTPTQSAFLVQQLIAAGAVPLGKANLDQFATGLNGTRSPYGACQNAFNPEFVSGGSSSGSAVSVAKGWVTFSLGTDTAGSGRVPASFNNLIGLKPTIGLLSATGQTLADLVESRMAAFPCSGEINFRVDDADAAIARVLAKFDPLAPAYDHTDGLSADFGEWRFNLRSSNTEPLLRLNVESRGNPGLLHDRTQEIAALISA